MNWRRLRFVDRILYWLGWFGPFVYLGVGIYMCWLAIRWIPSTPMPDQLFTWLLLVIGLVCLRQSYKEFLEVRDAELLYPSSERDDKPEWRHPLTPELREQLLSMFSLLKTAGIIGPDEVTDEEVVDCAEHTDVFEDMDIHSVSMVLESLADEREPPLDHFTFFTDQAGPYDDDAFEIVGEFARISGYGRSIASSQMRNDRRLPRPLRRGLRSQRRRRIRIGHCPVLAARDHVSQVPTQRADRTIGIDLHPARQCRTVLCLVGRHQSADHIHNPGQDREIQCRSWTGTDLGADRAQVVFS
ncbi:hypothetical protein [Mycolicibacterium houstonense]|uniref:hypothetical protein n=1 Tax=Mycolicibacterium houstonense TaxID=146021 RepID=UPI000A69E3AD|nr:hypothetical protein [Mycolicibacterium houstonense]